MKALALAGTLFALLALPLWLLLSLSPLEEGRWFVLGLYVATAGAAMHHWCFVDSGAATGAMGITGEEWTDVELRRLRRKGWRTINHLVFRGRADIDHIAVGPDGVIVIESKFWSGRRQLDRLDPLVLDAAEQALRNQKDVQGHLGWGAKRDARITSLVVVWGREVSQAGDEPIRTPEGVNVIAGEHLRTVLSHLNEASLTPAEIDAVV